MNTIVRIGWYSQWWMLCLLCAPTSLAFTIITDVGASTPSSDLVKLSSSLSGSNLNVESNNDAATAQFQLGQSFQQQKNLVEAASAFRRSIELEPNDNNEAQYQLGAVLTEMGYVDEAVTVLRELVEEENNYAPTTPFRAQIALANVILDGLGLKTEALEIYRQCCQQGRQSPMALLAGIAADSLGDHDTAEELYKSDCPDKLEHTDPSTALHLMLSRIRAGDPTGNVVTSLRSRLPEHIQSSVDYILSTSSSLGRSLHYFTHDMIQLALESTSSSIEDGLILEFGVYHGKTLRLIASHFTNQAVHGFDTFTGIPEAWHSTPSGSYSTHGILPQSPENVEYHVGLFSDTLPEFLETQPGPIQLMNIDCDLYSSTKDVLDAVHSRIVPGTIVIFDEYVMNPNWKQDEYKAWQEAIEKYGWEYEYIAISLVSCQAIVRIL